ncbi:FRG domain-containing protein [Rathayibacter oskolensis]|uniref:FRG domain-containing protein n=1 Tax=Rathayibacter oskolensis TaxID=1891671 RepID=A0A1X7PAA9_9MICO|nr:FRG domain-containing protein [Rathayibacter oskolensis]SMH47172.1 FRG domain-containing protein [Rathayibacter oskolensis]
MEDIGAEDGAQQSVPVVPQENTVSSVQDAVERFSEADLSGAFAGIAQLQEYLASPAVQAIAELQESWIASLRSSLSPALASLSTQEQAIIAGLRPLFQNTLSKPADFQTLEESPSGYSTEMTSPSSYYERDQGVVDSFDSLNEAIVRLISKNPSLKLVWRGQQNAEWGMHSGLFRRLMQLNGVKGPQERPEESQPYPDERQLVQAERKMLDIARDRWRLDGLPALEIFARLQHHAGPTRFIDITRNPYIAAWFAVEASEAYDTTPARLFGIAVAPAVADGDKAPDDAIRLDDAGGTRDPFWHSLTSSADRQGADWGTGAKRRIWIPPAYDQRIVAQNAGFLLDGVPMMSAKIAPYFKIDSRSVYWKKADLLAAASLYLKTAKPSRKAQINSKNLQHSSSL